MLNRFIYAISLCVLLSSFFHAKAQDTRIDSLKHALKTAQGDTLRVYLRNELGRLYINSKPDTSLVLARESFAIAGDKEFNGLMAATNMIYANGYNNLGNRDSAEVYFNRAIQMAAKYKRASVEAASYLGLGTCYNMWKKHNQALQCYLAAYKMYHSLGDSSKLASVALGIGNVYSDLNNIARSQEYFTVALNSAISRNDTRFIAKCYNNLGNLFQRSKEYDKAFQYYTKSVELKKILKDEHGIANTYLNFGNIYTLTKKPDLALLFYGKATDIYSKLGDSASYMGGLSYIGECYLKQGRIKEALVALKKAEGICIRNHYAVDLAGIYGALTKVYILQADTSRARVTLEKYTAIKDTLLSKNMQQQIAQITAQFENDKQRQELLLKDAELAASKKLTMAYLIGAAVSVVIFLLLIAAIVRLRKANKLLQENARETQKQNRA